LSLVLLTLLACGSNPPAPVEDRTRAPVSSSRLYQVQQGDTLYSIAFRYGMDFRRVAAANRIPSPYTIYPGQKIQLREATPPPVSRATKPSSPTPPPKTTASTTRQSTKPAPKPAPSTTQKHTTVTKPSSPPVKKSSSGAAYTGRAVSTWQWPAEGRVIRKFSSTVHKGIDIAGKRGDPVKAVADGKVVYAGTGIVGFGELLIVKHNDIYLSAYGHNDRLLVAEGQTVRAGQKIAEKGSTGTDIVKLHFEIRKEGKPVDPLRLLPRR
jgi:lipoprotein NlpD